MQSILLVGDARLHIGAPSAEKLLGIGYNVRTLSYSQSLPLNVMIDNITEQLQQEDDVRVLIVFSYFHDLTQRSEDLTLKDGHGLLKAVKNPDVSFLIEQSINATKNWKILVPGLQIIWTIPSRVNFLQFNTEFVKLNNQDDLSEREIRACYKWDKIYSCSLNLLKSQIKHEMQRIELDESLFTIEETLIRNNNEVQPDSQHHEDIFLQKVIDLLQDGSSLHYSTSLTKAALTESVMAAPHSFESTVDDKDVTFRDFSIDCQRNLNSTVSACYKINENNFNVTNGDELQQMKCNLDSSQFNTMQHLSVQLDGKSSAEVDGFNYEPTNVDITSMELDDGLDYDKFKSSVQSEQCDVQKLSSNNSNDCQLAIHANYETKEQKINDYSDYDGNELAAIVKPVHIEDEAMDTMDNSEEKIGNEVTCNESYVDDVDNNSAHGAAPIENVADKVLDDECSVLDAEYVENSATSNDTEACIGNKGLVDSMATEIDASNDLDNAGLLKNMATESDASDDIDNAGLVESEATASATSNDINKAGLGESGATENDAIVHIDNAELDESGATENDAMGHIDNAGLVESGATENNTVNHIDNMGLDENTADSEKFECEESSVKIDVEVGATDNEKEIFDDAISHLSVQDHSVNVINKSDKIDNVLNFSTCDIDGSAVQTVPCVLSTTPLQTDDDVECLDDTIRTKIRFENLTKKNYLNVFTSNIESSEISQSEKAVSSNVDILELPQEDHIIQSRVDSKKIALNLLDNSGDSQTEGEVSESNKNKLIEQDKYWSELLDDELIYEEMDDDIINEIQNDGISNNSVRDSGNSTGYFSTKDDETKMKSNPTASAILIELDIENKSNEVRNDQNISL